MQTQTHTNTCSPISCSLSCSGRIFFWCVWLILFWLNRVQNKIKKKSWDKNAYILFLVVSLFFVLKRNKKTTQNVCLHIIFFYYFIYIFTFWVYFWILYNDKNLYTKSVDTKRVVTLCCSLKYHKNLLYFSFKYTNIVFNQFSE